MNGIWFLSIGYSSADLYALGQLLTPLTGTRKSFEDFVTSNDKHKIELETKS